MSGKKVSRPKERKTTLGESAKAARGSGTAIPEPQRISKEPSEAKYAAMAGAMFNALERLRAFYRITRETADKNCGWIQPGKVDALLAEVTAAANILRVGLKARNAR